MLNLLLERFQKALPEQGTQRKKFGKKILNGSKWILFHAQRQACKGLHKRDSYNQKGHKSGTIKLQQSILWEMQDIHKTAFFSKDILNSIFIQIFLYL